LFFGNDVGTIFITMLLGAIVCVALLIVAILKIRRQTISSLLMVVVFRAVCWALVRISDDVRTVCRWALHENAYKAEVLAQPSSTDGRLKHVEWDGWGFVGSGDMVVYLVFDPNDSLASAATGQGSNSLSPPNSKALIGGSQWALLGAYQETNPVSGCWDSRRTSPRAQPRAYDGNVWCEYG
jgi:hypothetical protein